MNELENFKKHVEAFLIALLLTIVAIMIGTWGVLGLIGAGISMALAHIFINLSEKFCE